MAVTRSTASDRARRGTTAAVRPFVPRPYEFALLAIAALVVLAGVFLVYKGRTATSGAASQAPINLNQIDRAEQVLPALTNIPPAERQRVARRVLEAIRASGNKLPNVGALARNGVLTGSQVSEVKPLFVVRDLAAYRRSLLLYAALFVAAFLAVHVFWMVRGFAGAQHVLPALLLLCGAGLIAMISLRDPLRDTLAFADFTEGVVLGALVLAAASQVDYRRLTGRLAYVPLLASFLLAAALIGFGSGPGGSDAKVNLLGFQPAELIRLLVVFFLAGYFADRWEFLRTLKDQRPELTRVSRWVEVPRLEYVLPVVAGVVVSLALFFLQRDLGPALIIAVLFLALYAVARDRYLFATAGLALILGGFLLGYAIGFPRTVSARVAMWLSPWDNAVRGGEQVVHSLWALATGGVLGTGLGLGDPEIMPAAHTDLVLAVVGEEWGWIGLLGVFALYAVIVAFGIRTALRARNDYSFFLALGLSLALALQISLIAGGILDLVPLSGVVTPFISYGRTALITNFALVGMLLALSVDRGGTANTQPFRTPTRALVYALCAFGLLIVGKTAWVQVIQADETVGAGALTVQADGLRRYQYNPRLLAAARSIPRGAIYDRNGLPIATGDWAELAKHRDAFQRAGIALPAEPPAGDTRYYPLGAYGVHLLGDLRTRANWSARNSSLAERDFAVALQGYDDRATVVEVPDPRTGRPTYTIRYDYRELLPLLRQRYQPEHESVRRIRERDRTLRMSIDARLQVRTAQILAAQLAKLRREKGAAVVMDAQTGDLLASVSYPWPQRMPPTLTAPDADDTMLDRARYGLYPPGSTFKVVTAMAALRQDPSAVKLQYECKRLPDGRVGNSVRGWSRPIRDDIKDTAPHGVVDMERGTVVSCNAYYAQLATYKVGAPALLETAKLLGIEVAQPNTADALKDALPQAGYGQGQVVATPFQLARAAATVANGGAMPFGRWVIDRNNPRVQPAQQVVPAAQAATLARYMREVVTSGTGRAASSSPAQIAGKTGTAELDRKPSHAWFIGFAPAPGGRRLAFAVLVENGQYGGTAAAPVAAEIMTAALQLGLLERVQ